LDAKLASHHRFYLAPEDMCDAGRVRFSKRESRHMSASLRVAVGDIVSATDGKGTLHVIRVEDTAGGVVEGRIQESICIERPQPPMRLFQALIRPARLELVVEKATELGVWGISPVRTSRSRGEVGPFRLERLRKTALEAMKQSLAAYVPDIDCAAALEEALDMLREPGLTLVARGGQGDPHLKDALRAYGGGSLALWVGPEGGFAPAEVDALEDRGAIPFTLGPTRLRSETAAIVSLGILRSL
jgi:16S rRNA (uracil1498-N3)-methyltransferase